MKLTVKIICATAIAAAAPLLTTANADIAYSDLAGGYNIGAYIVSGGPTTPIGAYESVADSFTSAITGNLSSIEVPISTIGADSNIDVSLDASNPLGGPLTTQVLASSGAFTAVSGLNTFTYTGPNVLLSAGVTYYVVVTPADANTFTGVLEANSGAGSQLYVSGNGTSYVPNAHAPGAMQVNVTPSAAPEVNSWLIGAGLLAVATGTWMRRSILKEKCTGRGM